MAQEVSGATVNVDRVQPERDEGRRVLILGCSSQQRPTAERLPAVERYDGPSFRVLRRYRREARPAQAQLSVLVLSAEHGLIPGDLPILPYNRAMTAGRARELEPMVAHRLAEHLGGQVGAGPVHLLVACSRAYGPALPSTVTLHAMLPPESKVQRAPTRPGERLACLHDWLHGEPPHQRANATVDEATTPSDQTIIVHLRGQQRLLSGTGLLARARTELEAVVVEDRAPVTWAVDVGGVSVSPKWLVGLGFGLPRSAFGTTDALRALAALGIPVRRRLG